MFHQSSPPSPVIFDLHHLLTQLTLSRKWFLAELGPDGLHKLLAAFDNKAAQAICTFAYCEGPGKEAVVFQGRTKVSRHEQTAGAGR